MRFVTVSRAILAVGIYSLSATLSLVFADVYRFTGANGETFYTTKEVRPRAIREFVNPTPIPQLRGRSLSQSGISTPASPIDQPLLESYIRSAADQHGLDPQLIHAMIEAESGYNAFAVSPKGALGLMQLMPSTAETYGVWDPMDPHQNINGGVKFMKRLLERFDSDLELALAAYNSGEANVIRHGRKVPPFNETKNYVNRVLENYNKK